jgi:hypothetical protein
MTPRRLARSLAAATALVAGLAAAPAAQARNHALLIGVAAYDDPAIRPLEGPRNDVLALWRLLTRKGFAPNDVTVLAEGLPERPDAPRPRAAATREAILSGLAGLAERAEPGDLVLIHYSGHGATQPEGEVEEGAEPEPGGRVQVLLPKDAGRYDPQTRGLRNAIVDKELGRALERIRATGARLFVIVDACHAGTVTRAGAGTPRGVDASALGAPDAAPAAAPPRPATRRAVARVEDRGAMVGFFAVDAWSEALERPLPAPPDFLGGEGAKPSGEVLKPFGLFTWRLTRALEQGRARSYRELARLVAADVEVAAGAPAAMFEGDLDAALPGVEAAQGPARFPARATPEGVIVEAGRMQGVDAGARLALFDGPTADAHALGAVTVAEAGAIESRAGALAAPSPASLWAQVESAGVGFRLTVAADAAARPDVAAAAAGLPIDLVEGGADIVATRAGEAIRLSRDAALAAPGGETRAAPAFAAGEAGRAGLRDALWRFARAANLTRLAGVATAEGAATPGFDVALEATRETDPGRLADPRRACAAPLAPVARDVSDVQAEAIGHCDGLTLSIANRGERDLDVAVFLLDPEGDVAIPSRDWRQNGCLGFLPAKAGRPLVVRTQARLWTASGPGHAGLHRVIVFALPRKGGMAPNLCGLIAATPPEPGPALRAVGARGFATLLARAGLADPTLRAANPFAEEEEGAGSGVAARQFTLDLRANGP